jgi:hypothetical protein
MKCIVNRNSGVRPTEKTFTILMEVCGEVKQYTQMYEIAKKCMTGIESDVQNAMKLLHV